MPVHEFSDCVYRIASLFYPTVPHDHVIGANYLAFNGMHRGWDVTGAMNHFAKTSGTTGMPHTETQYLGLEGVMNLLAGTSGWGLNAAASRWAGFI